MRTFSGPTSPRFHFLDLYRMITISKFNCGKKFKQQHQSDSMPPHVLEADPCGLIRSYVNRPPRGRISPNEVFLLWRISNGFKSNRDAAKAVIKAYGRSMAQSNSAWLNALLRLFNQITVSQQLLPHPSSRPPRSLTSDNTVRIMKTEASRTPT